MAQDKPKHRWYQFSLRTFFVLVTLVFLHMRRFRPGGQLDAALLTASCAGRRESSSPG